MGFTPCKTGQSMQGMELQEKEAQKAGLELLKQNRFAKISERSKEKFLMQAKHFLDLLKVLKKVS